MIIKRRNTEPKKKLPKINPEPEKESIEEKAPATPEPKKDEAQDVFEGFNLDMIDFSQRQERRRGDRRRGYRRIDDRNLISRAQEEAIYIKEQSYKEGYDKGLEEAKADIYKLNETLVDFLAYKEDLYRQISGDLLDISITVAEKIIKKEVSSDKSVLDSIVHDALKNLAKGETKIILKVAPQDVDYTKGLVPDILSTGQIEAKIYVTGDEKVDEGSVVIETSNGLIDANISTQLNMIKEAFKQI